LILNS